MSVLRPATFFTCSPRRRRGRAKANTDLCRLEILVAVGNVASIRVAEKIGGVGEGILRSRLLLHGEFHHAVLFSVIL